MTKQPEFCTQCTAFERCELMRVRVVNADELENDAFRADVCKTAVAWCERQKALGQPHGPDALKKMIVDAIRDTVATFTDPDNQEIDAPDTGCLERSVAVPENTSNLADENSDPMVENAQFESALDWIRPRFCHPWHGKERPQFGEAMIERWIVIATGLKLRFPQEAAQWGVRLPEFGAATWTQLPRYRHRRPAMRRTNRGSVNDECPHMRAITPESKRRFVQMQARRRMRKTAQDT